jgi:uncharacterized protein YtpQ (UPF0354 family)
MFDLPLWFVFLVAFLLFYVLPRAAGKTFRRRVRMELIAYMKENLPNVKVAEETELALELRVDGDREVQLNLHKVYMAVASLRPHTPAARRKVFEKFTDMLRNPTEHDDISLATHGDRILPRIVNTAFLNSLPDKADLPHRPLGFTGLEVAYVFDSEHHVAYITRDAADDLGLDDRELHNRALTNLRKLFQPELIANARGDNGSITILESGDGHDVTRLLLVSEHLNEGEVLAAVLPSRDTLILAPAPANDDWSTFNGLATTSPDALSDRALKITHHSIEPAPLPVES